MAKRHLAGSVRPIAGVRGAQRGVSANEYALIASLIAVAAVGAITATGEANAAHWTAWVDKAVAAIAMALP